MIERAPQPANAPVHAGPTPEGVQDFPVAPRLPHAPARIGWSSLRDHWAPVGRGLGTGVALAQGLSRAVRAGVLAPPTAGHLAGGCQLALPLLLAGAVARASGALFVRDQMASGPLQGRLAMAPAWLRTAQDAVGALLGLATGLAYGPCTPIGMGLHVGLWLAGITGLALHVGLAEGHVAPGLPASTLAAVALQAAAAPLAWSIVAGAELSAALLAASLTLPCAAALGGLTLLMLRMRGRGNQTAYADGHVVQPAVVQQFRADLDGEKHPTVLNVPPALQQKLADIRRNVHLDAEGIPYTLGLPIVTLDGPPGTGKTSLACAVAQHLGATLLATSAATLNRVQIPGLPLGLTRASALLLQAEFMSLRSKKLVVVFIDEAGSLFPAGTDLSSPAGINELLQRVGFANTLAIQNSRRNGVILVAADNHAQAHASGLVFLSPNPPVWVPPPTATQLGDMFRLQMTKRLQSWQADGLVVAETAASLRNRLLPLADRLASLAQVGGVGRDAAGLAARLDRAARSFFYLRRGAPLDAAAERELVGALYAQAHATVAGYSQDAQTARARQLRKNPPVAALAPDLDEASLTQLFSGLLANPFQFIRTGLQQSYAVDSHPKRKLDVDRILAATTVAQTALFARYLNGTDWPSYAAYGRLFRRAQQSGAPQASQPIFLDTLLPISPSTNVVPPSYMLLPRTEAFGRRQDETLQKSMPQGLLQIYLQWHQKACRRFVGEHADTCRLDLLFL